MAAQLNANIQKRSSEKGASAVKTKAKTKSSDCEAAEGYASCKDTTVSTKITPAASALLLSCSNLAYSTPCHHQYLQEHKKINLQYQLDRKNLTIPINKTSMLNSEACKKNLATCSCKIMNIPRLKTIRSKKSTAQSRACPLATRMRKFEIEIDCTENQLQTHIKEYHDFKNEMEAKLQNLESKIAIGDNTPVPKTTIGYLNQP